MEEQYTIASNEYVPLDLVQKLKNDYIITKIKIKLDKVITEKPNILEIEFFLEIIEDVFSKQLCLNNNFIYYDNIIELNVIPLSIFTNSIPNNFKLQAFVKFKTIDIYDIYIEKPIKLIKIISYCNFFKNCIGCISSNCFNSIEEVNEFIKQDISTVICHGEHIKLIDNVNDKELKNIRKSFINNNIDLNNNNIDLNNNNIYLNKEYLFYKKNIKQYIYNNFDQQHNIYENDNDFIDEHENNDIDDY